MKKQLLLAFIMVVLGSFLFLTERKSDILPAPLGPYAIGTATYHFTDTSRLEKHSANGLDHRELVVQVWYPADEDEGVAAEHSFYIPRETLGIIKEDVSRATGVPIDKLGHLDSLRTHALVNAPLSTYEQSYPLIIFSPGFGMPVNLYTSLLEDLASYGYIVAGINYPYVTNPVLFPDGRIVKQAETFAKATDKQELAKQKEQELHTWVKDIQFVLDQFKKLNIVSGKTDFERIGVMGHSFGGSAALEVCRIDDRCKAGVDIDSKSYDLFAGNTIKEPFMFLVAPHGEEKLHPLRKIAAEAPEQTYFIELEGTDHGSFTDLYLIAPGAKVPELEPQKAISAVRVALLGFFDPALKPEVEPRVFKKIDKSLS